MIDAISYSLFFCRLHLTVDDMHKKYGDIFRVRVDAIDAVFLSSADYIRSIFTLYEGKYPKHPVPPAWIYLNEKFKIQRGLLFMYVYFLYCCLDSGARNISSIYI